MISQWIYGLLFIVLLYFAYKISKKKPNEKIPEYKDSHRPNKELLPNSFVDNKNLYILQIFLKKKSPMLLYNSVTCTIMISTKPY